MGCGYDFACQTCKKSYYLGYGSYRTWMTFNSLAEFDANAAPAEKKDLSKNQNIRKCLEEHDGHNHVYVGWDWNSVRGGVLYDDTANCGEGDVFIPDWGEYERINLAPD